MKRWLCVLIAPFAAMALHATTVIPMSVEQLTRASTHVVDATAVNSSAQWNPEHTLIFTYTRFSVGQSLKGQLPQTIVVRQLGGTVDGITQKVAGVMHWLPGQEAVLFLKPSSTGDGAMVVTGLMQGNFLVKRSANGEVSVTNGMPEVREHRAASGEVAGSVGNVMRLDELESRIRKAESQ